MYLVNSIARDKGSGRYTMYLPFSPYSFLGAKGQIHCVSARPLVPGKGFYRIHGQSLNTHRGKHRSGGAQSFPLTACKKAPNPMFVQNLSQRLSFRVPVGGTGRGGKDPHPQNKIQHLDFTKDPRPLYYKTPPCVVYHKKVRSKAVFGP